MAIKSLIFDFDGLILDTETPDVIAWMEIFKRYGQKFNFEKYKSAIGTVYRIMEPAHDLARLINGPNAETIYIEWSALEKDLINKQKILPGIMDYLIEAKTFNLKTAIASSAEMSWVDGHLRRLGIREFFDFVHTVDEIGVPKPFPNLYQAALNSLKITADEAIAFEDSVNGIMAAKNAGIFCVAVPNQTTRLLNLEYADLIIDSLANLPLSQLLSRFNKNSY